MAQRILVVEDDAELQDYVRMVLSQGGYEVTVCGCAAEARRSFQSSKPDLLILDIDLPDGNGMDLSREFSADKAGAVRFLFMTAAGDLKTRMNCFHLGAQDFIPKPFAPEELLARVQVHLANKNSQDELARRNQELEVRQRVRDAVANVIVHDLRNPLTLIKSTLDLTRSRGLINDAHYEGLLATAGSAADLMALMLSDILDVGQAETAPLKTSVSATPLAPILDKLRRMFDNQARIRKVKLTMRTAAGAENLQTDAALLLRILVNLLSASVKSSPTDTEILLECSRAGDRALFVLSDAGPEIPPEELADYFPRQLTTEFKGGAVIGRAFCRVASEALGGSVRVSQDPDGVRRFVVDLPAVV